LFRPAFTLDCLARSLAEQDVHGIPVQMRKCPFCLQEEVHRVSRTTLERVFVAQAYECRACGDRSRIPRRPFSRILGFLASHQKVHIGNEPR